MDNSLLTSCAITDAIEIQPIIEEIAKSEIVSFDFETTGLEHKRSQAHGISFATADHEWYICQGAMPAIIDALKPMFQDPKKLWLGHNLVFDLHFLNKFNILPTRYADTMVAQWLVDENQSLKLKELARTKLGYTGPTPTFGDLQKEYKKLLGVKKMEEVTIFDIPLEVLAPYGAKDARFTYDLWQKSLYDLDQEGMTQYFWEMEMPFLMCLFDMEENGFYLDQPYLHQLKVELEEKHGEALERWNKVSGNLNPNSNVQVADFLYTKLKNKVTLKTKTKAPSVEKLALQRLLPKDKTGAVQALLDIRLYEKLESTYVDSFLEKVYSDGRLYGGYNQTGTVTGRISSSGPNLQNIPSRTELSRKIRRSFGVAPGNVMIDCDYSQIELRILAFKSRDPHFLQAFREGLDPHQMTADNISKLGYTVKRRDAKSINFGWIYGMSPRGLCDNIEENSGERPNYGDAEDWLNGFDQAYEGAAKWRTATIQQAREQGYVTTIGGRRRRAEGIKDYNMGVRSRAERQSVNAVIQGSAGDLIKYAMINLRPYMHWFSSRMLSQVHDELVFEAPASMEAEAKVAIQREMERVQEHFGMDVKVIAEPNKETAYNWADAH